jgi:hypothetical protein
VQSSGRWKPRGRKKAQKAQKFHGFEDDFAVNDSASKSFCLLTFVLVAALPSAGISCLSSICG